ncbi:hypothetical protein QWI17_11990 [Gilvimarinus sp. SDUM040013]|uniref:Uncharacterized protein n=1 Tax=Gilvimarinus gilvus TaxID=3058038 RepID=A0ABU4RW78_9GAMM|nr:hypothetical protein [Gilvimarinus sp. SDUM040013]MDO3386557.1 hypothetical protein [Gilvimarinus sp. SDUM040013]MDX6849133.1 hypothetical protein [Gilvimarinus sp. SDUM040013]
MRTIKRFVVGMTVLMSTGVLASPFSPESLEQVIADWGEPISLDVATLQSIDQQLQWVEQQLEQAKRPGQSFRYELATQVLQTLSVAKIEKRTDRIRFWLARAYVAQHQHEFEQARINLRYVLRESPQDVQARLMAARIELVAGNLEQANTHCSDLLGSSDLLSASACLLEVRSYQQDVEAVYPALEKIIQRAGLPSDNRRAWLEQMMADMAVRMEKYELAQSWLKLDNTQHSVSYLSQWAEVQLLLGHPNRVLQTLGSLNVAEDNLDDVLVLKLALAERLVGEQSHWREQMAERVALREARNDWQHAAHLARYYLDVASDNAKALHWAQINITKSKELYDQELLARALALITECYEKLCRSSENLVAEDQS